MGKNATHGLYYHRPKAGLEAAARGMKPKHPVVLIPGACCWRAGRGATRAAGRGGAVPPPPPAHRVTRLHCPGHALWRLVRPAGFVTSSLETWQGNACAADKLRQRVWGGMSMVHTLLGDVRCWVEHMSLDPTTGLDPPGIKLRAAAGLDAIEFFAANFWCVWCGGGRGTVWFGEKGWGEAVTRGGRDDGQRGNVWAMLGCLNTGPQVVVPSLVTVPQCHPQSHCTRRVFARMVTALADIGYDASNLIPAPYDWCGGLSRLCKHVAAGFFGECSTTDRPPPCLLL